MAHWQVASMRNGCRFELEGADSQAPVEGVESAEEAAAYVSLHPATHAEVRALAADLQVLGRSEFKQLLKWCALVLQRVLTDPAAQKHVDDAAGVECLSLHMSVHIGVIDACPAPLKVECVSIV